jgi:hypothetical protein
MPKLALFLVVVFAMLALGFGAPQQGQAVEVSSAESYGDLKTFSKYYY